MKPTLKTFGISPIKTKFLVHTTEDEFRLVLGKTIDNLMGINEEVVAEGLMDHDKKYRGTIAGTFFEAKSKHEVLDLKTYEPWIIRGDFVPIGSNIELMITTKSTRNLQSTRITFLMFPMIFFVLILMKDDFSEFGTYWVLAGIALIVVLFHVISRWFQFSSIRKFLEELKDKGVRFDEDRYN